MSQEPHRPPTHPSNRLDLFDQSTPSLLHQTAKRHATRAGWLATTALYARLHESDEPFVDVGLATLNRPHGVDPTARR
jgi:hypothetical protein